MSFEKDITSIKKIIEQGGPLFKAASDSDLNQRSTDIERRETERQSRLDQERKEKEDRIEKAKQEAAIKIKATMKLLGMTKIEHDPRGWGVYIDGANNSGTEISMRLDADRIIVYGYYPTARGESHTSDVYNDRGAKLIKPKISISAMKTPDQMAKDIQRRFMPQYKEYFAAAKLQADKWDKYEDDSIAALEAIKGSKLDRYEARDKKISIDIPDTDSEYSSYGHFKANGTSLEFEIHGITAEQGIQIMKILQGKVR